ncbi:MAG: asparagine synthase (glutamine-hydrolyzing) [Gemmatimonadales bacterium]
MCGICGVCVPAGAAPDRSVLERMTATLAHRGPDDQGVLVEPGIGLGHRRLSIIDLSSAGHQPMESADGRFVIAFNGEIYNYREIGLRIEATGRALRTRSDTEVLLEAFGLWGETVLPDLRGMFAFALFDRAERRLWLVRDRFGIKPLYYRRAARSLVFGSEVKAILAHPETTIEIDWSAIHQFLWFGNTTGEATAFSGVAKLSPGTVARFDESGWSERRYWLPEHVPQRSMTASDAIAETRHQLEQSVRAHMVSDVPVGVFLSGGIDSSAITAYASKHASEPLRTYSVGFDDRSHADETVVAARVAAHFGTAHQEVIVTGAGSRETIEALVRCHDEPFGDAANIPLYLLCQQLGGAVKVVLQGDGGDELFAGYRRYAVMAREGVWGVLGRAGMPLIAALPLGMRGQRLARFLRAIGTKDAGVRMALMLTVETEADPPSGILSDSAAAEVARHDPFVDYRTAAVRFARFDAVARMLLTDQSILLPNTFLEKVDKSTMAHGVEVRVPFLDPQLSEFAMSVPSSLKVSGFDQKRLLRASLRGVLPDWVLDRPKTGFGVPYDRWLRGSLKGFFQEVMSDPSIRSWDALNHERIGSWHREHVDGRRNRGFVLWKTLHLALWYRSYVHA